VAWVLGVAIFWVDGGLGSRRGYGLTVAWVLGVGCRGFAVVWVAVGCRGGLPWVCRGMGCRGFAGMGGGLPWVCRGLPWVCRGMGCRGLPWVWVAVGLEHSEENRNEEREKKNEEREKKLK
jgi:hypothetical protein